MSVFGLFTTKQTGGPQSETSKLQVTFEQQKDQAGLFVTEELERAIQECRTRVERISQDCRAKNRKFRDVEFDIENDQWLCLYGLNIEESYNPSDVQRATELFEDPSFFHNGIGANDIHQGALGDCWFLSALATMTSKPGLIEKCCVARDEKVGVYGFVFFRDASWVSVVIDDLLCTSVPKFEELNAQEQALYHGSKDIYNDVARKNGRGLYFAKSGKDGEPETWVPLIEKAYAKLHGDFASLEGGWSGEAIEDLTGGVSTTIRIKDILDIDRFWKDELCRIVTHNDRLFGCSYRGLSSARNFDPNATINGLFGNHAYSILRVKEVMKSLFKKSALTERLQIRGKRFVVIRNPWGNSEWTGPWSDGSKEWTPEWLEILPELEHVFGDDGVFVMEYKDFLQSFDKIDRVVLFNSDYVMSSQWLRTAVRPLPSVYTYGDVSFTITVESSTPAIIVFSKLDDRYFNHINGRSSWNFDLVLYKRGEEEPLSHASNSNFFAWRSVNMEVELEPGEYVVHVRIDRIYTKDASYYEDASSGWDQRKLSRVLSERARGQSIASNFKPGTRKANLPVPLSAFAGKDLTDFEVEAGEADERLKANQDVKTKQEEAEKAEKEKAAAAAQITTTTSTVTVVKTVTTNTQTGEVTESVQEVSSAPPPAADSPSTDKGESKQDETTTTTTTTGESAESKRAAAVKAVEEKELEFVGENDQLYVGLKVYTKKGAPAQIKGQLRHDVEYLNLAAEEKWWAKK